MLLEVEYSVASVHSQDVQTRSGMSELTRPGFVSGFSLLPSNNRHVVFQFKRTFKGVLGLSISKKPQYKQCALPGITVLALERYINTHLYLTKCSVLTLKIFFLTVLYLGNLSR